jgi:hypothetical protein
MMTQARPTRIAFALLALVPLMTAPIAAQPVTPPEPDVPAGSEARIRWSQCNLQLVSHGRYVVFQMAEVAIPRQMF